MQEQTEKQAKQEKREDGLMQDDHDEAHAPATGETEGAVVDICDGDNGESLATETEKQCDVLVGGWVGGWVGGCKRLYIHTYVIYGMGGRIRTYHICIIHTYVCI